MNSMMLETIAVNYVKYGLVAWAIWIVAAIGWIVVVCLKNPGNFMVRKDRIFQKDNKGGKRSLAKGLIVNLAVWPYALPKFVLEVCKEVKRIRKEIS